MTSTQMSKSKVHKYISDKIANATEDVIIYDSTNNTKAQRLYFASLRTDCQVIEKYFPPFREVNDDYITWLMQRNHPIFPKDFAVAKKLVLALLENMEV